jgi:hypothetical protein
MSGFQAFYEAFMSADVSDPDDWSDYEARLVRYQILWAFYENTAYRDIHAWSKQYRQSYGMYKYSRNIYNPAYRIGSFWQSYLWGGSLDLEAGDGSEVPSALPIVTNNEALRPAIGQIWLNSKWASRKSIVTLWGAVMGDVGMRVVDDPERKKVYLSIIHPATIEEIAQDDFGNVKGYSISEMRHDDEEDVDYDYRETASREGQNVIYTTFRDEKPYGFNGMPAQWSEAYGFVPMVMVKHNDIGMDWGWSELFPALSKVREADDLASKVSDQVRKLVDAPWLMAGVKAPGGEVKTTTSASTADRPEPGREQVPMIYAPEGATATPLVAPLDLAAAEQHIKAILEEIERDFPELQADIWTASGDASGRALRVARQKVEGKVRERRASYDDALVRAQQMAIAIGGLRNYAGFSGFGLESYQRGDLDHTIDPNRPVFAADPLDELALAQQQNAVEMQRASLDQQRAMGTGN